MKEDFKVILVSLGIASTALLTITVNMYMLGKLIDNAEVYNLARAK